MLRAIIIDDEERSRTLLSTLVEEYCKNVQVLTTADDVPTGVKAIHKHQPDMIFLDIEMPGYTGFELLDFFDDIPFEIVFTTAYREYAVQAFQASAIDYLLKPIQIKQLVNAVEKVENQLNSPKQAHQRVAALKENMEQNGGITRIALPISDGLFFVNVSDITYIEADRSYCKIYMADGDSLIVSKNLKEFEKILTPPFFFRTHRSFIINLNKVKQFTKKEGGYIIMDNGDMVNLTRERRDSFLKACSELPLL